MRTIPLAVAALLAALMTSTMAIAQGETPLRPVSEWKLVPATGVEARLEPQPGGIARIAFEKASEEPRMVAMAVPLGGLPGGAQTLVIEGRLALEADARADLVVAMWEKSGACWYKSLVCTLPSDQVGVVQVPIAGPSLARFSEDDSGALEPMDVERLWIGVLLHGPAKGVVEFAGAHFSTEPYRAAGPLAITGAGAGEWTVGADPAVTCDLTTPNGGPNGEPCLKYEFTMPGMRHMYCVPAVPVPAQPLEGYSALKLTYKADLPPGISGLLLMIGERGAQFYADPPPPASADWTTLTVPLTQFKLGTWSQDDNGVLDMGRVDRIMVGIHGAATTDPATGAVWVTGLELVP